MIVLSCNNLYKSFGIDSILENICFSVNEGDKIGIIGVNGTGKTTLMKIISGEYGYDEHSCNICGGLMLSFTGFGKE